ncbi:hypothetical protein AURDEDRAFT_22872, partial [Auricularia subglabra TFB-10046 SS5]
SRNPSAMDYNSNTYLAVTVSPSSPYISNPASLADVHSQLQYVGKVGELADVQLFSVPKSEWETVQAAVQQALKGVAGVQSVDVQVPKQRAKRDE